jgi:hypothetical protein
VKPKLFTRFLTGLLALALLGGALGPAVPVRAQGSVPGVNVAVAFFNLISLTNRRNRAYREARLTQQEMNAYYDSLIAKARAQLRDRQLAGANQSQLAVYVKLVARLERERAAVTQQIEAEKNQARQNFNRRAVSQVTGVLVNAPGAQSILGDVRNTLRGLREAATAIQTALNTGKPVERLVENYASRYQRIPALQNAVRQLGYGLGDQLDRALGGLLSRVQATTNDIQANLGQAIDKTNELDAVVAGYQQQDRQPVSLVVPEDVLGNVNPVSRANAAVDVAAQAYTNAAVLAGAMSGSGDKQRSTMRERIRQQLLQQRLDALQAGSRRAGLVDCTGTGRKQYELAAQQLGLKAEQPQDSNQARYLVCLDRDSGLPVYAALIGAAQASPPQVTGTAIRPTRTPKPGQATPTHAATTNSSPAAAPTATAQPQGEDVTLSGQIAVNSQDLCPTFACTITANQLTISFNTGGGALNGTGTIAFTGVMTPGCDPGSNHMNLTFQGEYDPAGSASGTVTINQQNNVVAGDHCDRQTYNFSDSRPWQATYQDGQLQGSFTTQNGSTVTFTLTR